MTIELNATMLRHTYLVVKICDNNVVHFFAHGHFRLPAMVAKDFCINE